METLTERTGVHSELWLSFVSMLRSYAAAASLHAGDVRVISRENTVTVTSGAAQLDLTFTPESSLVGWNRHSASSAPLTGSFIIEPGGTLAINGVSRDLDHAAIDFIAFVTAEGKGSCP